VLATVKVAGADQWDVLRAHMVASPFGRERGRVRVDTAQLAFLRAGSSRREPLTFIRSPSSRGEAALLQFQLTIKEHYQEDYGFGAGRHIF